MNSGTTENINLVMGAEVRNSLQHQTSSNSHLANTPVDQWMLAYKHKEDQRTNTLNYMQLRGSPMYMVSGIKVAGRSKQMEHSVKIELQVVEVSPTL